MYTGQLSTAQRFLQSPKQIIRDGDPKIVEPKHYTLEAEVNDLAASAGRIRFKTFVPEDTKANNCSPSQNMSLEGYNIILTGASGVGKTTALNAMVNHILGVELADPFRFQVAHDMKGVQSRTRDVTAYSFPVNALSMQSITVIDTPGFSDTRGVGMDARIEALLTELLMSPTMAALKHVNAIGMVVKGSDTNIDIQTHYNLERIFGLLGKNLAQNIVWLITFSDIQRPVAFDTIDAICGKREWPSHNKVALNNSAWNLERHELDELSQIKWRLGNAAFSQFFETLKTLPSSSLTTTKEVLSKREHLEIMLEDLRQDIDKCSALLSNQLQMEADLEKAQAEWENGKNFSLEEVSYKTELEVSPGGVPNLNCKVCLKTCQHYTLAYYLAGQKFTFWFESIIGKPVVQICEVFESDRCSVCPKNCPSMHHVLEKRVYTEKREVRLVTVDAMLHKLVNDNAARASSSDSAAITVRNPLPMANTLNHLERSKLIETKLHQLATKIDSSKQKISNDMKRTKQITAELSTMGFAVAGSSSVTTDYFDYLISREQRMKRPGWEERVKNMKNIKESKTERNSIFEGSYNPFPST